MDQFYTTGILFQEWKSNWGLRGDPYLWDDMKALIGKEPLPASVTQLTALMERAFEQIVGAPVSSPVESVYIKRYDQGGMSGGHVCIEFWRDRVFPELQKKYVNAKSFSQTSESLPSSLDFSLRMLQQSSSDSQQLQMISKPCRFEFYPEGCRYGTACRFRHSFPIKPGGKVSPTSVSSPMAPYNPHVDPLSNNISSFSTSPSHSTFGAIGSGLSGNSTFSQASSSNGVLLGSSTNSSNARLFESSLTPSIARGPIGDNLFCLPTGSRSSSDGVSGGNPRSSSVCIHFLRGKCTFGTACRFAHF